jgi:hypothetical protein
MECGSHAVKAIRENFFRPRNGADVHDIRSLHQHATRPLAETRSASIWSLNPYTLCRWPMR